MNPRTLRFIAILILIGIIISPQLIAVHAESYNMEFYAFYIGGLHPDMWPTGLAIGSDSYMVLAVANWEALNNYTNHVFKFFWNGSLVWEKKIINLTSNGFLAQDFKRVGDTYIIVGGTQHNDHLVIIALDSDGNILWSKQTDSIITSSMTWARILPISDNEFWISEFNENVSRSSILDMFTNGTIKWLKTYYSSSYNIVPTSMDYDKANGVVYIASFENNYPSPFIVTALNASTGDIIWNKGLSTGVGQLYFGGISVTSDHNIVLAGNIDFQSTNTPYLYIAKSTIASLTPDGQVRWAFLLNTTKYNLPTDISSINNDVMISGSTSIGNTSYSKGFLMRLDENGNIEWFKMVRSQCCVPISMDNFCSYLWHVFANESVILSTGMISENLTYLNWTFTIRDPLIISTTPMAEMTGECNMTSNTTTMINNIFTPINTSSLNYTLINLHSFDLPLTYSQLPIDLQDYPVVSLPVNLSINYFCDPKPSNQTGSSLVGGVLIGYSDNYNLIPILALSLTAFIISIEISNKSKRRITSNH